MSWVIPSRPALPLRHPFLYAPNQAPTPTVRMRERLSDKTPSLWTSFAVAWLLVLALVVWHLPSANLSQARLGVSAACLLLIALSYLWLTVRRAPDAADLTG